MISGCIRVKSVRNQQIQFFGRKFHVVYHLIQIDASISVSLCSFQNSFTDVSQGLSVSIRLRLVPGFFRRITSAFRRDLDQHRCHKINLCLRIGRENLLQFLTEQMQCSTESIARLIRNRSNGPITFHLSSPIPVIGSKAYQKNITIPRSIFQFLFHDIQNTVSVISLTLCEGISGMTFFRHMTTQFFSQQLRKIIRIRGSHTFGDTVAKHPEFLSLISGSLRSTGAQHNDHHQNYDHDSVPVIRPQIHHLYAPKSVSH